jgi:aldehyde dehydrogenase (NAD+)
MPGLGSALTFIIAHGKPLALYAFTTDRRTRRRLLTETSSGAVGCGLPHSHLTVPGLPFGGVGESGLGRYHGRPSVETFSNVRAVLDKPLFPDTVRAVYPPLHHGQGAAAAPDHMRHGDGYPAAGRSMRVWVSCIRRSLASMS